MEKLKLQITGMKCERCANRVKGALTALPGIDHCRVSVGAVELTFDNVVTTRSDLFDVIRRAGAFEVSGFSTGG